MRNGNTTGHEGYLPPSPKYVTAGAQVACLEMRIFQMAWNVYCGNDDFYGLGRYIHLESYYILSIEKKTKFSSTTVRQYIDFNDWNYCMF